MTEALPGFEINPYLFMPDKSKRTNIDGLIGRFTVIDSKDDYDNLSGLSNYKSRDLNEVHNITEEEFAVYFGRNRVSLPLSIIKKLSLRKILNFFLFFKKDNNIENKTIANNGYLNVSLLS